MNPKAAKLIADLALVALGLYGAWSGWKFGLWSGKAPGPGLFPFAVSVALAALSGIAVLTDLAQRARAAADEREGPPTWGKFGWYLGALVFSAFALEPLGYLPTVTVAFVCILKIAERLSWSRTVIITAVTLAVCEVLFVRMLDVELPKGLLESIM